MLRSTRRFSAGLLARNTPPVAPALENRRAGGCCSCAALRCVTVNFDFKMLDPSGCFSNTLPGIPGLHCSDPTRKTAGPVANTVANKAHLKSTQNLPALKSYACSRTIDVRCGEGKLRCVPSSGTFHGIKPRKVVVENDFPRRVLNFSLDVTKERLERPVLTFAHRQRENGPF